MLIELLSTDNYLSFNIKLASIIGLHPAVYVAEVLNIYEKACRKKKVDENDFFILDRNYIRDRTTLTRDEQLKIDATLVSLNIMKVADGNKNKVSFDLQTLTSIIAGTSDVVKDISKIVKDKDTSKQKKTKVQEEKERMKSYIRTSNEELREAYEEWIEAVYAKLGWMSKKAVTLGEDLVDNASNRDLDVALKIIDIATVNGYKDMTWAVKMYKDCSNYYSRVSPRPAVVDRKVVVSEEVF